MPRRPRAEKCMVTCWGDVRIEIIGRLWAISLCQFSPTFISSPTNNLPYDNIRHTQPHYGDVHSSVPTSTSNSRYIQCEPLLLCVYRPRYIDLVRFCSYMYAGCKYSIMHAVLICTSFVVLLLARVLLFLLKS